MDGLIAILAIIWIANALLSGSKKKKQQAKAKGGAQRAAAQPKPAPKPAVAKPAAPKTRPASKQVRIPFSKEEWAAYLNELSEGLTPPEAQPAAPRHDEFSGEGSVSTQGESQEEHAEHHRRIADEEARLHQEREALNDLRAANLSKLRAAVVMSEVLGKPVALRPRTGYHK